MIQQNDMTDFSVGFVIGIVVLSALVRVRPLFQATLCAGALAIGYLFYAEGVPGLVASGASAVEYLSRYPAFTQGVAVGKLATGLIKWRSARSPHGWWL